MKDYFSLGKDILICFSYISPCSFQSKSDFDSLEAITRDIHIFKNNGNVFIRGDLNARTGVDPDFIVNDSDKDVPLDPSYIIDSYILQLHSEDTKVDDRGKQVNELCISSRMRILNGSKHNNCVWNENYCMPDSFKWNKYSSQRFRQALEVKEIQNKIKLFMEREFDYDETDVENACDYFENLVVQAATKSLKQKSSTKVKKRSNKWYDEDLYVKRRLLNSKASLRFKQRFNVSLRNSYFKHYREYRKLPNDDLESNDPKAYWNLVNSLKKEQEQSNGPELAIDLDTWYDHFRNLNSLESKFDERLEQLNQVIENDKQTRTFNLMDTVNVFKSFINDLPFYLNDTPDPFFVNDLPLNCLMYGDDIVLLSTTPAGLQDKLNKLHKFCKDWCLEANVSKPKVCFLINLEGF